MKKRIVLIFALVMSLVVFAGCEYESSGRQVDTNKTLQTASRLQTNQPTPNDIEYSLERYNLIRRAYWVNGMRERANTLPCEIEKPLGYIVLFSGNATVGAFVVDGKVSSLNSFLTPDSEFFEKDMAYRSASTPTSKSVEDFSNKWLADVDGSYGENDSGIFFFTPDGKYIEWSGDYLYSDIPFVVDSPMVRYTEVY